MGHKAFVISKIGNNHCVRIWSFSGPNARKFRPEKLRIRTLHVVNSESDLSK